MCLVFCLQSPKRILRSNEILMPSNGLLDTELDLSFSLQVRDTNTVFLLISFLMARLKVEPPFSHVCHRHHGRIPLLLGQCRKKAPVLVRAQVLGDSLSTSFPCGQPPSTALPVPVTWKRPNDRACDHTTFLHWPSVSGLFVQRKQVALHKCTVGWWVFLRSDWLSLLWMSVAGPLICSASWEQMQLCGETCNPHLVTRISNRPKSEKVVCCRLQ